MTVTFIEHCCKFYNTLDERATTKKTGTGVEVRIFTGNYGDAWKSTNISQTYYSPVRKELIKHNAIEVLQKGSRSVDTVVALYGLPDTWNVDGWRGETDLTNRTTYAMLQAEVSELKKSTGGMNVLTALQELESRIVKIEATLENLELILQQKELI